MLEHLGDWLCTAGHETGQACVAKCEPPAPFLSTLDVACYRCYCLTSSRSRSGTLGASKGVNACSKLATTAQTAAVTLVEM